jgi:hypothetical protein
MAYFHPDWIAHQRERWMPPRAQRWLRPAQGWAPPSSQRFASLHPVESEAVAPDTIERDWADETQRLDALREITSLRLELALLRLGEAWRRKANFNPNQPFHRRTLRWNARAAGATSNCRSPCSRCHSPGSRA